MAAEGVSLAQVESELRAAEAYLHHYDAAASEGRVSSDRAAAPLETSAAHFQYGDEKFFRRRQTTRPVLSEDRRKEILAKLAAERHALLRPRTSGSSGSPVYSGEATEADGSTIQDRRSSGAFAASDSPDEHSRLLRKLFQTQKGDWVSGDTSTSFSGAHPRVAEVFSSPLESTAVDGDDHHDNKDLEAVSDDAESNEELFYASDIVGSGAVPDVLPRSRMEILNESEEHAEEDDQNHHRTFARQNALTEPTTSKRIELLAQPRTDKFTERERQRLALEVQSFRECTFRPDISKSQAKQRSKEKDGNDERATLARARDGSNAFPWLMLSPRRQSADHGKRRVQWSDLEHPTKNVIQRLHLDGAAKYEQRERAKAEMEAWKLRECTFTPKINASSRCMLDLGSYKPIHQRLFDIQRAKIENIKRVQEKIESAKGGAASFTPSINPISREIAAKVHGEKAQEKRTACLGEDDSDECRRLKPPKVIERLASEAEKLAEKRIAIQEYYDAVQQQSFAPTISDNSNAIVQHKPEFRMDFVARQLHFQTQGREKREALEDVCERAHNDGERITFTPDIGNADSVLRELRPDRFSETKDQKLYRLMYNDAKQTELKKQRLRDEELSKFTFKPEINPISRALGRSSTLSELAQPVASLARTNRVDSTQRAAKTDRHHASSSRAAALQQYFAGKRFRSRVALEMEQAEKAECTFHPTLVTTKHRAKAINSSSSASKLCTQGRQGKSIWRSDNILHLIETDRVKKAEELEAKRCELELRELSECTFQPKIRKARSRKDSQSGAAQSGGAGAPCESPLEQKPVIVRGLGRFLEMKEQAKRLRAEQKQREEKAFRPNTAYEPRSYTIPKPFNLSEPSKDATRRRLKMRQELRVKEKLECTFTPETIESKHRKVLANLLRD